MDDNQQISDDGGAWKYFAPMLHIDDDDLNPYQYRLLGHYRRVCGVNGGKCTESTETTATKTKMSVGKVCAVRKQLAKLGRINLQTKQTGTLVSLRDCWRENILRYSQPSPNEQLESLSIHHMNTEYSPHETKNNQIQEQKDSTVPKNGTDILGVTGDSAYVANGASHESPVFLSKSQIEPTQPNIEQNDSEPAAGKSPENAAIDALIAAYLDCQKIIDQKAYAKKGYRDAARALYHASITPDELRGFIAHRKEDSFWADKTIRWAHIEEGILTWKDRDNHLPPEHRIIHPEELLEPSPERILYPERFVERDPNKPVEMVDPELVHKAVRDLAEKLSGRKLAGNV